MSTWNTSNRYSGWGERDTDEWPLTVPAWEDYHDRNLGENEALACVLDSRPLASTGSLAGMLPSGSSIRRWGLILL